MKSLMKKLSVGLGISFLVLALTGCNPLSSIQNGNNAVEYNNKIIGYQGEIIQSMLSMVNEIAPGNNEKVEAKRQELVKVIDKNIASLTALEAMPDDQGLKAAALELFNFYKSIAENEYKSMIEIVGKENPTAEDSQKILTLQEGINKREAELDEKMAKVQEAFAQKYGFQMIENQYQNQIDNL